MTPRERLEAALRGEPVDFVPFAVYENHLPRGAVERRLRDEGLCVVVRAGNVYRTSTPGVTHRAIDFVRDGVALQRTWIQTPAGTLTRVTRPAPGTVWTLEHLFKSPADYPALRALVDAEVYTADESGLQAMRRLWGDDGHCRASIGYSPLQQIIYRFMGPEAFSIEWHERRDQVLDLIDRLAAKWRALLPIVAASSAEVVNVCGNPSPQVLGRERFAEHLLPYLEQACALLRPAGKLVGSHLDAGNALWADLIAGSSLDYVEAFTPPPDGDLSVAEARRRWPGKVLWVNFPGSLHHAPAERIAAATRELLEQAGDRRGFILGITETVPPDRWAESYATILATSRAAGPLK